MSKDTQLQEPEKRDPVLSLPVQVNRLKSLGEVIKGEADEAMCKDLAERLGILEVNAFSTEIRVLPWKKNGVRLEGVVRGKVKQACVVTLEPVPEEIDEPFFVTMVPDGSPYARRADNSENGGEMIIDPEGEDPPETFTGDEIDVGAYAEEFFALALDDYPRSDNADFAGHIEDDGKEDASQNPFAALAGLKEQMEDKDEQK